MELLIFIAGVIVGYFIEKFLDILLAQIDLFRKRRSWQKAERVWQKYQAVSFGLEVIQVGWINNEFSEEQVVITVDKDFKLQPEIAAKTLDIHKDKWEKAGLNNNVQFGISEIDPHRVSDEIAGKGKSHELRIRGHTYRYFEFLSTHKLWRSGNPEERAFLENKIDTIHYLEPEKLFPNPLSVGLSLFCENGNCLVLTKRTTLTSSGGLFWGGSIYNAVGENVTLVDAEGNYQGITRLSIWKTAKRGLQEEMGIEFFGSKEENLIIHSLVWDNRVLDYKFFGHTINGMSRAEVRQLWMCASDRHESWEITFRESSNREQCLKIIDDIVAHREDWGSECILCTIRSLLHTRKISPNDLAAILAKT